MKSHSDLELATISVIGKASRGVSNDKISSVLRTANAEISDVLYALFDEDEAILAEHHTKIRKAERILSDLENGDWPNDKHYNYHEALFNGGEDFYTDMEFDNVLDAITHIKLLVDDNMTMDV